MTTPAAADALETQHDQRTRANGLEIAYDTFRSKAGHGEPLFLIMGIGAQRIFWPEGLCEELASRGYEVIRFDNRDVGQSTRVDHLETPSVLESLGALAAGKPVPAPYTLDHMADDTVELMSALDHEDAHVCGASMGGMIAQTVAIRHPTRIRTLTSIMSTTGNPSLPPADPNAMAVLTQPAPQEADAYADHAVKVWRTIGSPGFDFNEDEVRERARLAFERGISPKGFSRQLAAILAHGNRKPALGKVETPTTVIHGKADLLVPVTGGIDTADAIDGAELVLIEGMGHDLPEGVWLQIADAIDSVRARVS